MRIGILQCDSVRAEFRQQFPNYPAMLQTVLRRAEPDLSFSVYDVQHGQYPQDLHECHGYVSTGSKASVYDGSPWINDLQTFIHRLDEHNIKFVGICFGHQLVAQAYGGTTEKSAQGWGVGIHSNEIQRDKDWMSPKLPAFNIIVSHQDQVTKLPHGAELLAGNAFCPYGMFQLGENILTLQGHPEFTKQYSETLMRFRADLIGPQTLQQGLQSLDKESHEVQLARWIINFLA